MEEVMNTKDELMLMDEIKEANKRHVEEFIQAHLKVWVADFAFIDSNGLKREWEPEDESNLNIHRSDFTVQVEALNIREALDAAEKKLKEMREESGWLEFIITDVGICNDNIW